MYCGRCRGSARSAVRASRGWCEGNEEWGCGGTWCCTGCGGFGEQEEEGEEEDEEENK